jgi:hypothetical protein
MKNKIDYLELCVIAFIAAFGVLIINQILK